MRDATPLLAALLALGGCRARDPGVAFATPPLVGELGVDRAIVWARASSLPAWLHVELDGPHTHRTVVVPALAEADATARVELRGLTDRELSLTVWLSRDGEAAWPGDDVVRETLRLAPPENASETVTFGFGADVAGQNVCRDRRRGFPLITEAAEAPLDFFLFLGDVIYADEECLAEGDYGNAQIPSGVGAAHTLDDYRAHYRYVEGDPGLAALRGRSFTVWDDHETRNDVGPEADLDEDGTHLLPVARRAMVEHTPLPSRFGESHEPMYRSVRWGRHVELFFLDTRSYREPLGEERPAPRRAMLGADQSAWLARGLARSTATWPIVVSSVPLAVSHGGDAWASGPGASGYERELLEILASAHAEGLRRLVVLAADVHFATTIRHRPFEGLEIYELVTGPLSAGLFPDRRLDPTLRPERLFFHGPPDVRALRTLDEALAWMSWGALEIDARGRLTYEVRGIGERVLDTLVLEP